VCIASYQKLPKEKPQTHLVAERAEKSAGVVISQDAESVRSRPSTGSARHGDRNEHGTAQDGLLRMDEHPSDIPCQLRLPLE